MKFTDLIKNQRIEDNLPFAIELDVQPLESFGEFPTVEVAGFTFPKMNDLVIRESWFFDMVNVPVTNFRQEVQYGLAILSVKLKEACGLESLSQALEYLFTPSEEVGDSEAYQQFKTENAETIEALVKSGAELSKAQQEAMFKNVTFFIASRVDGSWNLNKTACLSRKRIEAIQAFLEQETNGGVELAAIEAPEAEEPKEGNAQLQSVG